MAIKKGTLRSAEFSAGQCPFLHFLLWVLYQNVYIAAITDVDFCCFQMALSKLSYFSTVPSAKVMVCPLKLMVPLFVKLVIVQSFSVMEFCPSITSASEFLAVSFAFFTVISAVEYTAGEL